MGLVAGNIVVTREKEPLPQEQKPATEQVPLKDGEPAVIVDGKVKKISKKSAFLLDMLSLD